jgi:hypothetical protein
MCCHPAVLGGASFAASVTTAVPAAWSVSTLCWLVLVERFGAVSDCSVFRSGSVLSLVVLGQPSGSEGASPEAGSCAAAHIVILIVVAIGFLLYSMLEGLGGCTQSSLGLEELQRQVHCCSALAADGSSLEGCGPCCCWNGCTCFVSIIVFVWPETQQGVAVVRLHKAAAETCCRGFLTAAAGPWC